MDKALTDLVKVSNAVGADNSLVQGGGGNTSVKSDDGEYMYIKASGTSLKNMSSRRGWRRLRTKAVLDVLADKSLGKMKVKKRELTMVKRLLAACDDNVRENVRPSVECPMHAVLSKCVIHLHAITAQAYTSARNGKAAILKVFKDNKYPPLWIPYANPGFELGHKIFSLVGRYVKKYGRKPQVLFMEKHGLLVTADEPEAALRLVYTVIGKCRVGLSKTPRAGKLKANKKQIEEYRKNIGKSLLEITGKERAVNFFVDQNVRQFLASENPGRMLRCPALTPDELIFVNGAIQWLNSADCETIKAKVKRALKTDQSVPAAYVVKDVGLFIASKPALIPVARDVALGSLFIRRKARNMGGINALSAGQRDFLKKWESEQFRVQLAAKGK